jgi:hypothetical protein
MVTLVHFLVDLTLLGFTLWFGGLGLVFYNLRMYANKD